MPIWSEETVEQLKALASQGFSAAQAAAQFDGMTRNAAVGLAFRRHFHFNGGNSSTTNRITKPKRTYLKPPPEAKASPPPIIEPTAATKISIMQLTESSCRFPLGDPHDADFGYCGMVRCAPYQYCRYHCILSYETPEQRRANAGRQQGSSPSISNQMGHRRVLAGRL